MSWRKKKKNLLRSQSRLRYIADRVLQSSCDMFQKNKDDSQWKNGRSIYEGILGISNLLGIQSSCQNMIESPSQHAMQVPLLLLQSD